MPEWAFLGTVVALAWLYDLYNGMNDAANAIATTVSTRAVRPLQAALGAGVLNTVGALVTTRVAKTIGKGIVDPSLMDQELLLAALLGAIVWVALATRVGIPVSVTHCMVGGLVGAGVAALGWDGPSWGRLVQKVFIPMVVSPFVGFGAAYALVVGLMWLLRGWRPERANRLLRRGQLLSASFMAYSHGANDTQNAMGVITAALVMTGALREFEVPLWVVLGSGAFMGLGTLLGGWRVIKTMGMRMVKLRPLHGFGAETGAGAVILGATFFSAPISTTHVISTCIMGAGATQKLSAIRWGITLRIVLAWVFTVPGAGLIAAASYVLIRALTGLL